MNCLIDVTAKILSPHKILICNFHYPNLNKVVFQHLIKKNEYFIQLSFALAVLFDILQLNLTIPFHILLHVNLLIIKISRNYIGNVLFIWAYIVILD